MEVKTFRAGGPMSNWDSGIQGFVHCELERGYAWRSAWLRPQTLLCPLAHSVAPQHLGQTL